MFKYFKWIVIFISVAGLGIFLLSKIGVNLISEVTEEIKVEKREELETAFEGKPAPYFELRNLSGETIKSSDFLGNPAVFVFWTTWNQNSLDQLKILDDYVRIKGETLFKVIAIASQEDQSAVSNFISRGGYGLTVLLDEDGAVTEKYGARNLPATFFIDRSGVMRDVSVGVISEEVLLQKIENILK